MLLDLIGTGHKVDELLLIAAERCPYLPHYSGDTLAEFYNMLLLPNPETAYSKLK